MVRLGPLSDELICAFVGFATTVACEYKKTEFNRKKTYSIFLKLLYNDGSVLLINLFYNFNM
ncbi:hypothetical protein FPN187_contig00038-0032 [Flavobacterium psychrophilum]|nr:hypothetical protein FPK15_contig00010-0001 [Flavobacterium psychrophilum]GEJ33233.1 hypothetical protein FPN181_contig00072-0001 [Flavobacterium psychrophilum]GEJ34216.1 hypothetical protein FPN184_contig00034-0001 [Flavobacterium psychrophilum]GEJ37830.1 hypothetical protein FPN187_contig00038-0032 [Flavobacterium psychrophilum]GEJ38934.1 hypothetical protein FPN186_contig00022-0032 [Flavobacterium psychrophilum]